MMNVLRVRGSLLRKTLFWTHLGSGVVAGLIILIVSATGVLLAYERQITALAVTRNRVAVSGQAALSAGRLAQIVREVRPDAGRFNLEFSADPAMPVTASQGRQGFSLLLNPYTGAVVTDAAAGTRQFFRTVENWHRWLGGNPRSTRASAVDIANLLFFVMTLSGLYLWFPAVLRWRTLRALVLFRGRYVNSRIRDFSWHHVFGIWMLIPLFFIAFSGVVMSYSWANKLVFAAFGETPPARAAASAPDAAPARTASLDELLAAARAHLDNWQRITLPVGNPGNRLEIVAEMPSSSGPRASRRSLVLDARTARVLSLSGPRGAGPATAGTPSRGQRLRSWLRFTHTGEQFGIAGQTLAALASLAACMLVYTGLALAFRRLTGPLLRRNRRKSA